MLAITAIVSTLVLQTIRAAAANGIRIERHSRANIHDRIDEIALRQAMANTLVDYRESELALQGTAFEVRGQTSRPIAPGQGMTAAFRLVVEPAGNGSMLVYEEGDRRYDIAESPSGQIRLSYWFDDSEQPSWISQWPPPEGFARHQFSGTPYYTPLPALLRVTAPDSDIDFVFALPRTDPPQARVQDLLGTSTP